MNLNTDTIAAVSTAVGGGIGIVRLSGENSINIAKKIFVPAGKCLFKSHRLYYGHIVSPNGHTIDQVILSIMKSPKSYTCENVVEINCHGGVKSLQLVLELVLLSGARLAEPGEFTKRAFLNGRIDLVAAQAVIDIINSKTEISHNQAIYRLEGKLSKNIRDIRDNILNILAIIEVSIDYPEHDMEEENISVMKAQLVPIKYQLESLIKTGKTGLIISHGIQAVILGKPNVGKSSLLNAILKHDRAIVTDVPGTTRDVLQESANIQGIPLRITDTAGIRATDDIVEKAGVTKSYEYATDADLIILVLDNSKEITKEDLELLESFKHKQIIMAMNKSDLPSHSSNAKILQGISFTKIELSAKNLMGMEDLYNAIYNLFVEDTLSVENTALVSNSRDMSYLRNAADHINEALLSIDAGMTEDIVAIDLHESYVYLGKIIGESLEDDVCDRIFSQFCLGK